MENNNIDFLKARLVFLKNKLKDFETARVSVVLNMLHSDFEDEDSFYKECGNGANLDAHIEFLNRCISIITRTIKEIDNA